MQRYGRLLRMPGVAAVLACAIACGLAALGALPLALVLFARDATGSFAGAGAAIGALAIGTGLTAPWRGRLVDCYGLPRVLVPLTVVSAGALAIAAALPAIRGHSALLIASAAFVGATSPPLIPALKTLLRTLVTDADLRQTAYAIQSMSSEVFYLVGPVLAAALASTLGPRAGLLCVAGLILVFGIAFALTPASRAWLPPKPTSARRRAPSFSRGMRLLLAAALASGIMLGALDIAIPAFAADHRVLALAGIALAALAAGSLAGGVIYGAVKWRASLASRFLASAAFLAIAFVPVILSVSLPMLVAGLFVAGLAVAPCMSAIFGLLDHVTPADASTESVGWLSTCYQAGSMSGAVLTGIAVEGAGVHAAIGVAWLGAVLTLTIALGGRAALTGALVAASAASPVTANPTLTTRPAERR